MHITKAYLKEHGFVPLYVPNKNGRMIIPCLGYYVNRMGQFIKTDKDGNLHFLPFVPDKDGYNRQSVATLYGTRKFRMARLVALTFIPNPNPRTHTQINHKNFNKTDDRVENLEWVTPYQNCMHYYKNRENSPTLAEYPILQCEEFEGKILKIVRRYPFSRDIPTIGIDGRVQDRADIKACCRRLKRRYHEYRWLYEKDRDEYQKQGYTFI